MAKKFLYVCGGIFLLALVYHLGARSATAQAPAGMVGIDVYSTGSCYGMVAIDQSGQLYETCGTIPPGPWQATYHLSGVPVALRTVDNYVYVLMENGDLYQGNYPNTWPPQLVGNVHAGPTPAKPETWGSVKRRYR